MEETPKHKLAQGQPSTCRPEDVLLTVPIYAQLVDSVTQRTMAKAHNVHHIIASRNMSVDFDSALSPILDVLVISFIICEEKRRDSQRSRNSAAAGAAGATC